MTARNYKRWKGFAVRVARFGWMGRDARTVARLVQYVEEVFGNLDDDLFAGEFCLGDISDFDERIMTHHTLGDYLLEMISNMNPYPWACSLSGLCEHWDETMGDRIMTCLRLPMNFVGCRHSGVLGFTAGDVRRIWQGRVPGWVSGVLWQAEGESRWRALDQLGDAEGMWL